MRRVEEIAKRKGHSIAQIACAWVLSKDPVAPGCFPNNLLLSAKTVNSPESKVPYFSRL